VDAAFQIYRREPVAFVLGLGLIYAPWLVISAIIGLQGDPANPPALSSLAVAALGNLVVYGLAQGVTAVLAREVYFDRPADIALAFRTVFSRFGDLIGAMLLAGFVIGFATIFLILPGLYAYSRLFAIKQAVLFENLSPTAAASRSSRLSVGLKRHILNTMILVFLIAIAVGFGGGMLSGLFGSFILRLVFTTCLSVVIYPMLGITEALLYYDTRIRREGFDVEYMASVAAAHPPVPAPS
jgi:hypothetical protein